MKKEILITGGAGFIGTKLVNRLLKDYQITILDNFLPQVHGDSQSKIKGVNYVIGDVCNKEDWEKALSPNTEFIFHLAAETGTGQSMDEISRYNNTNIIGTSIMVDLINSNYYNVKKIILASSRAVYGEKRNIVKKDNTDPISIYGLTKLVQEQILQLACKIPYTIFRYQNVYGPGQSLKNPYTGIISIFSECFKNNKDITIWDNGLPTRDFIYVEDVISATILALDNPITNNKTYNVGTGKQVNILEVANTLKSLIKTSGDIKISDYHRPGDVINAVADVNCIKKDLKWETKYNLNQGIKKFIEWFLNT